MASERVISRLWSVYSRFYDGLLDLVPYQDLLNDTVEAMAVGESDSVADLGCGTGNVGLSVLRRNPGTTVTLVDSSPDMLAVARDKVCPYPGATLEEAELNQWLRGAPSGSVDRLVTMNVLYTFDEESRREFWRESLRVLAPGGRLVVVTSDRPGIGPVVREQYRRRGSVLRSLTPRLVAITVLNLIIWMFESRRVFHPVAADHLRRECEEEGGAVLSAVRCYGGPEDGVDVLMVIEPVIELTTKVSADSPGLPASVASEQEPPSVRAARR